jgi:hypothetical protein
MEPDTEDIENVKADQLGDAIAVPAEESNLSIGLAPLERSAQ